MSKLLKFKPWLTLEEATRHLSAMLSEAVAETDVLRLALDGHLTLSVNIVNGARARPTERIAQDQIHWMEVPGLNGHPILLPDADVLPDGTALRSKAELVTLRGVFDLTMLGPESLDVEQRFQMLTDGPAVELTQLSGVLLRQGDRYFTVMKPFYDESDEEQAGSEAAGRMIDKAITAGSLSQADADELLAFHASNREEFKREAKKRKGLDGFYPAPTLPRDAVFVVRTDALRAFHARAMELPPVDKPLGTRERDTLLKLVIGMATSGYAYNPEDGRSSVPADIASDVEKLGLSMTDDTVRKWLKEAKALLPGRPG